MDFHLLEKKSAQYMLYGISSDQTKGNLHQHNLTSDGS